MGSTAGQIALGVGLVAVGGALTVTGNPFGGVLISAGIGIGLGGVSAALAPTPEVGNQGGPGINRTVRSASTYEQVIYGQARVGGQIVAIDRHTVKKSGLQDPDFLDLVVVVSAREVEEFLGMYLGDDFVPLQVQTGNSSFYPKGMYIPQSGSRYRDFLGVNLYTGRQVAADQFLIDRRTNDNNVSRRPRIAWDADHKLLGYAYAVLTLRYDPDIYPSGIPNLSFLVKGARVYDPRTGLTAYTDNAALCIADYLASDYGPAGVGYAEINAAALIASANACDEEVEHDLQGAAIPGIAPGTETITEARYRISAAVSAETDWRSVAPKMAEAIGGGIFRVGAGWYIVAGTTATPSADFDEEDMVAELDVLPRRSRRDLFNRVHVFSRNEHDDFQVFDAPALRPNRYLLQDAGNILITELDVGSMVASPTQAMRIASIDLETNRQQIAVTGTFKWRALAVEVGDVIRLSSERMGWTLKPFRVVRWEMDPQAGIKLGLSEYCDAIFSWPPDADLLNCSPDTTFSAPVSTQGPRNLAVARVDGDDSTISWTAPTAIFTGYELRYKPIGEVPGDGFAFDNDTFIALETDPLPDWTEETLGSGAEDFDAALDHTLVYRVEIRAIVSTGIYSEWVGVTSFPED